MLTDQAAGLSQEQLDRYHEEGFLHLAGWLPVEEVERLAEAWSELRGRIQAGQAPLVRDDRFVHGELPPPLGDIYREPRLAGIARQLFGPDLALYFLRILVKDAHWNGPIRAHQDMVFFHGGQRKLMVFVPLEPCTLETGGLSFIAGSHRFGNLGVRGTIRYQEYPELPVVTPELVPGDVLLADIFTWHFSAPTTKPCDRPLVQIVYQPADDGSYRGSPDRPTLVSGQWRTRHFLKHGDHITPDNATRGERKQRKPEKAEDSTLAALRELQDLTRVPGPVSRRHLLGPLVNLARRALWRALRPLLEQQTAHNWAVERALAELRERLDARR